MKLRLESVDLKESTDRLATMVGLMIVALFGFALVMVGVSVRNAH
jgi:hypothetical protein